MPALRLYGRTWNTASDMLPAIVFLTGGAHAAWLALFGGLWFGLLPRAAAPCTAPGLHYQVFMCASLALFAVMLAVEVATFYAGWRGAPLEVSKRRAVQPLAYALSALWLAQLLLTIYGLYVTAADFSAAPCWTGGDAGRVHGIAVGMVATVAVFSVLTLLFLRALFQKYQDTRSVSAWHQCFSGVARTLGATPALTRQVEGRAAALPQLARVLHQLFGDVDITVSDAAAALVLTAAAQQNRRRQAIEKAAAAAGLPPPPLDADGDGSDDDDGDPDTGVGVGADPRAVGGGRAVVSAAQRAADAAADAADAAAARKAGGAAARKAGGAPPPKPPAPTTLVGDDDAAASRLAAANAAAAAAGEPPPAPSSDWAQGAPFPVDRRISVRFPTLITPSELHAVGDDPTAASDAHDQFLGERARVPYDQLVDAAHFGRFACAVYGVTALTDPPGACSCGGAVLGVRGACGLCVPSCAPAPAVTHASIRTAILDTAGIGADDLLFFSHANEALASLPYMICLDRARRTVVLAVRGTASLSDAITDLALNPVDVAQYVPPDVATTLTGPALAHAGIVRAAEAVLASVDAMGVLDALLTGDRGKLCAYASGLDDDARAELVAQASGPLASVASAAGVPPDRLAAACEAALPDTKGWRLVVTGHSLGAGTAAVLALILKPRVPGVRCWAFSPPGCTVSAALIAYTRSFVTSIAAGKDVVTRVGAVNLNRLIDEMMVSLARSKYPKLKVFCGGWWRRAARPPPRAMFHDYKDIPAESAEFLRKYFLLEDVKDRGIVPMFPPGRIFFMRPLKSRAARRAARDAFIVKSWDGVYATAQELVAEGILVGKAMLEDHLIEGTVLEAIAHAIIHHPDNPSTPAERAKQQALARRLKKVADLVVETRPESDTFASLEAGTRI